MSAELRPWIGKPPRSELPEPEGYTLLRHEQIPLTPAALLGLALFPIWGIIFVLAMSILGGRTSYEFTITLWGFLAAIGVIALTTALHEIIHGLAALLAGQRPSFGMGKGYFYTTIQGSVSWGQYLAIALSPGIAIGAGSIIGALIWPEAAGWLMFASMFNASGVGGDLWMARRVLAAPRNSRFYDLADGFAVYIPDSDLTQRP